MTGLAGPVVSLPFSKLVLFGFVAPCLGGLDGTDVGMLS